VKRPNDSSDGKQPENLLQKSAEEPKNEQPSRQSATEGNTEPNDVAKKPDDVAKKSRQSATEPTTASEPNDLAKKPDDVAKNNRVEKKEPKSPGFKVDANNREVYPTEEGSPITDQPNNV